MRLMAALRTYPYSAPQMPWLDYRERAWMDGSDGEEGGEKAGKRRRKEATVLPPRESVYNVQNVLKGYPNLTSRCGGLFERRGSFQLKIHCHIG